MLIARNECLILMFGKREMSIECHRYVYITPRICSTNNESLPEERKVGGSIPGRFIPKDYKNGTFCFSACRRIEQGLVGRH